MEHVDIKEKLGVKNIAAWYNLSGLHLIFKTFFFDNKSNSTVNDDKIIKKRENEEKSILTAGRAKNDIANTLKHDATILPIHDLG